MRLLLLLTLTACGGSSQLQENDVVADGQIIYPAENSLSPVTGQMAERFRSLMTGDPNHFSIIGDESSASSYFLSCLKSVTEKDDKRLEPVTHFLAGGGPDPFLHRGNAVAAGAGFQNLKGERIQSEIELRNPSFAIALAGKHDLADLSLDEYSFLALEVVEEIKGQGALPVLTAMFPRIDDPELDEKTKLGNHFLRAVAQELQTPFINPSTTIDSSMQGEDLASPLFLGDGCDFSSEGLSYGHNARNSATKELLTTMLDVMSDSHLPSEGISLLTGTGTLNEPFSLGNVSDFVHLGNTLGGDSLIDFYDGCNAEQNESGAEVYYRFELSEAGMLHANVASDNGADLDVHLLAESADGGSCMARGHKSIQAAVNAGTYFIVIDSFTGNNGALEGRYMLHLDVDHGE